MIIFKSIKYKNFLSTGNKPNTIILDNAPVTIVTGANGTGKSSGVIDAIFYALYGKPYRKLKKDQMINSINMKNLEVELVFCVGKSSYTIKRGMKPNLFEIYVDGVLSPAPAAIKDYQSWLEDSILKMNAVTMRQIVFLGSTSYVPFMRLSPGDRRKVVEEILDIQVFSTMNLLLRGRVSAMSNEYSELVANMKLVANNISLKQKHLSEITMAKEEFRIESMDKIKKSMTDIDGIREQVETASRQVEELFGSISDSNNIRDKRSELKTLVSNISRQLSRANKEIDFFEDNSSCPTCKQTIEESSKTNSIEDNKKKIDEFKTALEMANHTISGFETRINQIVVIEQNIHNLEVEISNNQTRIGTIQSHVDDIQRGVDRKLDSANQTSSSQLENEISEHEKESDKMREARNEISNNSQYYQIISSLLKDGGIKSQIINNYLPTINSLIRKYLEILEFPCEFTFDEEFNETMKSRYRDKFSYANFSEGQKMRIDLALLFAWRELARLRNSASCNLLVLDEVGSSSLDAEGTQAFMRIIEETSKDNNVFIISHDTSVTDTDSFSCCLEYTLVDNFSTIKESS